MGALSVSWRDLAVVALLFSVVMLVFAALSFAVAWPNAGDGWGLAVIVAGVAALLPLLSRTLTFLQKSRGSIQAFGVKIDFAGAVQSSQAVVGSWSAGTVRQGTFIAESGRGELERAAEEAGSHPELVIDLEAGNAWYRTRLFAVAAMGEVLGAPKYLVLVGQKGGRPLQVGGYIAATDFVRAVCQRDPRYARLLKHATDYLPHLREAARKPPGAEPPPPAGFDKYMNYTYPFREVGDALFMRILVEQLIHPDPGQLQPGEASPEDGPPWINLAEMEQELSPWLVHDTVDTSASPREQVSAILAARGEIAIAARDGTFEGLFQVDVTVRHVLRQLIERVQE